MEIEEKLDQKFDFSHNIINNPAETYKSTMWDSWYNSEGLITSCTTTKASSSSAAASNIISFQNSSNPETDDVYDHYYKVDVDDDELITGKNHSSKSKLGCASTRSPLQAKNHVMAERKRRQNLNQLFINLSKAVPGLKKLDKGSVLEDAINYLKGLKERVRVLEEDETTKKKKSSSSIACINYEDAAAESSNNYMNIPEIKARISDKHVLIKIFCKKVKGLMSRIPCEMEKINFITVVDIRIMPFGVNALHITILAEMQGELIRGQVKDIVDLLHHVITKSSHGHF